MIRTVMYGYAGYLLRVNLDTGTISKEVLQEEHAKKFLGGRCLGAKILLDELSPEVDPLAPENKLLFMTGPLTGTTIPCNSRYVVMSKSPLTRGWGESLAGGFWGPELKFAGFDGIIIEGASRIPVYLWIHDGEAEILDSSFIWGRNTYETERRVKEHLQDSGVRVAGIGPAGEKLVKFASIMSDFRAAGRSGLGAVMGSKKLKAIAVRGSSRINVDKKSRVTELSKEISKKIMVDLSQQTLGKYGTARSVLPTNERGMLPTKLYNSGIFEEAEAISGETISRDFLIRRETCYACPIRCKGVCEIKGGKYSGVFKRPEYETLAALGSLCLNNNLRSIIYMNHICNLNGLDTITSGHVISLVMECFERGILEEKDFGFRIKWGDHVTMIRILDLIVNRQGIGRLLGEGTRSFARKFEAVRLAAHVKGLEMGMAEVRGKKGVGLSMATSPRGGTHMDSDNDTVHEAPDRIPELRLVKPIPSCSIEKKPEIIVKTQDLRAVQNSAAVCVLAWSARTRLTVTDLIKSLNYVTGWNLDIGDFIAIGERANNLCRAFNVREGMTRKHDSLPDKFFRPMSDGPLRGQRWTKNDLDTMLDEYYELRGWDNQGIPKRDKLDSLGLNDVYAKMCMTSARAKLRLK